MLCLASHIIVNVVDINDGNICIYELLPLRSAEVMIFPSPTHPTGSSKVPKVG